MSVVVKPGGRRVEVELQRGGRVAELLEAMGYRPGTAVAVRRGEVLTEDEALRDGDGLEVYEAVSGG